ncbi:MAG: biopolymer transporter ExbD [Gemmataceae bacterium]|nr:biopolymer transporter ExbD [Gemmataceae bacterium]
MRRKRKHSQGDNAKVEIPIPAMLDMTFQFLSFFILTFNPPSVAEGQMDMFMPAAGQAKAKTAEQVDPFALSNPENEPGVDITVAIESRLGVIDKLTVKEKENSTVIAEGNLKELKSVLATIRNEVGPANVKIEADGALKYEYLIAVMDVCLGVKFQSVGFSPPPDLIRR